MDQQTHQVTHNEQVLQIIKALDHLINVIQV
jgi:hypothetical protein